MYLVLKAAGWPMRNCSTATSGAAMQWPLTRWCAGTVRWFGEYVGAFLTRTMTPRTRFKRRSSSSPAKRPEFKSVSRSAIGCMGSLVRSRDSCKLSWRFAGAGNEAARQRGDLARGQVDRTVLLLGDMRVERFARGRRGILRHVDRHGGKLPAVRRAVRVPARRVD